MAGKRAAATPHVVLVGRPNVGKSTLFNRITGTRRAIVTPIPGTTRDVIVQPAEWLGSAFTLVDTGGLFGASADPLHELVVQHGRRAIDSADVVVFVVDGREGLVSGDEEIAKTLRPVGVPIVLAVNKIDDKHAREEDFHQLGFDSVIGVAAEHGQGVGDLLDEVLQRLPDKPTKPAAAKPSSEISIAIVGRPNVGKSSLVNRVLREERVMVSELPGTTRDPIDTLLRWHGRDFRIVDTAGIRRAGKVAKSAQVESVSVVLARRAIERADVAVMLIDAVEGPTDQDAAIAGEAERAGCGVIIAVNKWDLVKKEGKKDGKKDENADFAKTFDENLHRRLKFLDYAPVLHISAKTGERTPKLMEAIERVADARQKRVSTGELNRFIKTVTEAHAPVSPGKREVRILYAAQTSVAPPTFVMFTNVATTFHFSYERFLINRLRDAFGFLGTPIRLHVRRRAQKGRAQKG